MVTDIKDRKRTVEIVCTAKQFESGAVEGIASAAISKKPDKVIITINCTDESLADEEFVNTSIEAIRKKKRQELEDFFSEDDDEY